MPLARLLARLTMTAAFQRMKARIRRSMCSSPGNHGSFSGGMVLMYGLDTVFGRPTPSSRARSSSFMRRNRARVRPRSSATISSESTHSAVSVGSMSGSCWLKPSKITIPVSHPSRIFDRAPPALIRRQGLHCVPAGPAAGRLLLEHFGAALRSRDVTENSVRLLPAWERPRCTPTAPAWETPGRGAGPGPFPAAPSPAGRRRRRPTSAWRSRPPWRRCGRWTGRWWSSATPPTSSTASGTAGGRAGWPGAG